MPAPDLVTLDGNALDGNALAGRLAVLGSLDVTSATVRCAGCGRTGAGAQMRAYVSGMGAVGRCPGCDAVLVVVVEHPSGTRVAMPGVAWIGDLEP
ncbi:DUF6510 family protein [Isoptericola variabilis]|uniref:Uncharacterized protein n=1 Tax=Isoptericola variabilis (strain 225) TaxID=743718 RepID=F6FVX9_ISOV2|nr:DUF6510 family protein [Isoptericola variabilis]AEG44449.1 hypothetical protein Isova_1698 [Isoptericola variabilis 225]TWH28279.1 hypothetical protein L600_004200000170 [Isoptericola variabilis J7]